MKDIVILYHASCSDGFSGAWAAWKKFGSQADYIAVSHQMPPPQLRNKEIYLIDFTYPLKMTKMLIQENKQIISIDHHLTAEEAVKATKEYSYSLENSGSVLAWKYFHPAEPIPMLLKYVEDMDLWRFRLPHSREIFAYLDIFDFTFEIWDKIYADLERPENRKKYIENGSVLLKFEEKSVGELVNNAELVEFAGYRTLAVNSPIYESQIGAVLVKKMPPIGIIWSRKKNKIGVSLRSDGKTDVSAIARKFGGGGHKAAAGFVIGVNEQLPWKYEIN